MRAKVHSRVAVATLLALATSVCAYADLVGPVITPWYGTSQQFGQLGRPQQWVNIVGNVSDADGVSSLTYSVNGGPGVSMGLGPDTRRLQRPGDFNADVDADLLNIGANTVAFTAFDLLGNVSNLVVNVTYSKGLVWPETYSIDWSAVGDLQDAAQIVDGLWTHDASGVRTVDVGYDRILDVGDIAWDAYEITVPLTVHSIDPNGFQFPSVAPGVGITLRWQGHTDFGGNWQPIYGWLPNGGTLWYDFGAADGGEFRIAGEQGLFSADPNDHEITFGVTYNLKFRVEPISEDTARYRAKVWVDGNPEPAGWAMDGIDGPGDLPTGSLLFVAHHVDATFGNVTITGLDNPNPPIISNVSVETADTSATIMWSTSEPATTQIDWGLTAGLELGTFIDPNRVLPHAVMLTGLMPGTAYQYQLTGVDDANSVGSSGIMAFVTSGGGGVFVSDDFSAPTLDPNVWTTFDPLGDSTISMTGRQLSLSAPAGTTHGIWINGADAPRAMQAVVDTDFEIEAKFDSTLTQRYQGQGILIEEDADTMLRYEVYSDGGAVYIFCVVLDNGSFDIRFNQTIASDGRVRLRVNRTGDVWQMLYSTDGQNWLLAGSFTSVRSISSVGVFGSNSADTGQSPPAHTALVDYAFDTAAPIVPEDNGKVTLDVLISGAGSVTRDPNLPIYDANTPVTLTATPDPGFGFSGWSGSLVSNDNPLVIVLTDDTMLTATFATIPDPDPPIISDLVILPTHNDVTMTWTTDELSTTGYFYGLTPAYELGGDEELSLVTDHSVTILGLDPNTLYEIEVFSVDPSSNVGSVQTFFMTDSPPVSTIVSDDFSSAVLDPNLWTFINPIGDSAIATSGAQAVISVPGGVAHPVWIGGIQAPRIMQQANNADFQVEAKYESLPSAAFQVQGIIVEQDPNNFIRINIQSDGITASVFVATFINGAPTIRVFQSISAIVPQWLRVTRVVHDWTVEYSFDGAAWISAGQFNFPIAVSSIGPFVGNEGNGGPAPAFDGVIDYFFNTASPIAPEDGGQHTVTLEIQGNGVVTRDPNGVLYALGTDVLLTAVPDPGWNFVGWSGDLSGPNNPLSVTVNADLIATATFAENDTTPPVISGLQVSTWTTSAMVTFTTDEPAIGRVDYGLTAGLELGTVTEVAAVAGHSITLTGLDPNTTYFYEAFATDPTANESSTGVLSFVTDPVIPSTLVSDDFDGTALDPNVWIFIDPIGDTTLTVGGSAATIDVPSGPAHDAWVTGVQSSRIVQATNDVDFEIVVKYDSAVTAQFQIQGIVVEQDPNNFIRFDVHYNGTTVVLFAATINALQPQVHLSRALGSSTPAYIRVTRSGNQWTLAYSFDGQNWDPQAPFTSAISVSTVGAFVGNSPKSAGPAPAHTGVIDFFQNTASPLPPRFPLTINTTGQGSVIVDPVYATYAQGSTITLTPVPEPGWVFMKWTGDVASTDAPLELSIVDATTVRARFSREDGKLRRGSGSALPSP